MILIRTYVYRITHLNRMTFFEWFLSVFLEQTLPTFLVEALVTLSKRLVPAILLPVVVRGSNFSFTLLAKYLTW